MNNLRAYLAVYCNRKTKAFIFVMVKGHFVTMYVRKRDCLTVHHILWHCTCIKFCVVSSILAINSQKIDSTYENSSKCSLIS